MKSIKSKLFISYFFTIFIIIISLCFFSIYFFNQNKQKDNNKLLSTTYIEIEKFLKNNSQNKIKNIDIHIDLQNQFLIIFQNKDIIFSNETLHNTEKILNFLRINKNKEQHHNTHIKDLELNYIKKSINDYQVYLGINERYLNKSLSEIYLVIIISNIVIFFILTILGYLLINKTINPLKQILNELKVLQNNDDLSKRLKENKTNDEFEQLINSLNKMLENIENSVKNIKQFTSDASHELKTPLTVIQGHIDLCKKENVSKEELVKTLNQIDLEQKKLQEIIKAFLLLSRIDKEGTKNKNASLDKILFECIEVNLLYLEEKNLKLEFDIQEDLEINFDEKYLQIVINNLLLNAIKYTKKGFVFIEAKRVNKKVVLKIQDSGIGIEEKNQSKIFERFYRVDKARTDMKDGIGLGLAIVKKICDRYNCKIVLESKVQKGSTFSLIFS